MGTGMLVLSRKFGEKIIIDNGRIEITIVDIRRDKVRVGIIAPGLDIHREEVFKAIQGEVHAEGKPQSGSHQAP